MLFPSPDNYVTNCISLFVEPTDQGICTHAQRWPMCFSSQPRLSVSIYELLICYLVISPLSEGRHGEMNWVRPLAEDRLK